MKQDSLRDRLRMLANMVSLQTRRSTVGRSPTPAVPVLPQTRCGIGQAVG